MYHHCPKQYQAYNRSACWTELKTFSTWSMSNHSILTQSKTLYNEAMQQLLFLTFYLKMWTIFTSTQDGDKWQRQWFLNVLKEHRKRILCYCKNEILLVLQFDKRILPRIPMVWKLVMMNWKSIQLEITNYRINY